MKRKWRPHTVATLILFLGKTDEKKRDRRSRDKSDRVGRRKKEFNRTYKGESGGRNEYSLSSPRESVGRGLHRSHIHLSRYSLSIR